jgi:dihydroorotate dehydrogenase
MSGKFLGKLSEDVSNVIKENSNLKIISSGGIINKEIGIERLKNFDLIQLYTGLVYEGPSLTKQILKSL